MLTTENRWVSYHLFLPPPGDVFLVEYLLPFVSQDRTSRFFRRFFYIRYFEKGFHLRLRFLPQNASGAALVDGPLRDLLCRFRAAHPTLADQSHLEIASYSRSAHYFGSNVLSVYAELLNEQTSYLALRLLALYHGRRPVLLLALTRLLQTLLELVNLAAQPGSTLLDDWLDFARRYCLDHDIPLPEGGASVPPLIAVLRSGESKSLNKDPLVTQTVRLLRRVRMNHGRGASVSAHAIHLLCNKIGVSIPQEVLLGTALRQLRLAEPIA